MYYKKQGITAPIIKDGSIYREMYFHDGYIYLRYEGKNVPSEALTEVTEEEYNLNCHIYNTEPEPTDPQPTNADILAALQRSQEELKQEAIDSYTMELMEQGIL